MDYKEIGCEGLEWINLARHRIYLPAAVNMIMKLWVTYWPGNFEWLRDCQLLKKDCAARNQQTKHNDHTGLLIMLNCEERSASHEHRLDLFNDSVSSSDNMAANGELIYK
jgi:hypothetical protein